MSVGTIKLTYLVFTLTCFYSVDVIDENATYVFMWHSEAERRSLTDLGGQLGGTTYSTEIQMD